MARLWMLLGQSRFFNLISLVETKHDRHHSHFLKIISLLFEISKHSFGSVQDYERVSSLFALCYDLFDGECSKSLVSSLWVTNQLILVDRAWLLWNLISIISVLDHGFPSLWVRRALEMENPKEIPVSSAVGIIPNLKWQASLREREAARWVI